MNSGCRITSQFGKRVDPFSKDLKFHNGIVKKVTGTDGHGKRITLAQDENYQTSYSILSQMDVNVGDIVKKGQVIALSGNSGRSTAPHLHYEVIKDGELVSPIDYLIAE